MCFLCNQEVHNKAQYKILLSGVVGAPDPVTLRITNGYKCKVEAVTMRSRALQFQAGNTRVPSDAIAGMLSLFSSFLIIRINVLVCVRHYIWVSSMLLPSLYYPGLLYAIFACREL